MANEQQNPEEENTVEETVEETAETIDEAEEAVTPEYADAEVEVSELEEIETETAFEESVTDAIEATAEASEDNPVAEAWDNTIETAMEVVENVVENDAEAHDHHYTDDVVLPYFGHVITMPGGIYTFIFFVLGALTIIEVAVTIIFPETTFSIAVLVLLSIAKAVLVIMYYMHLKDDNPLYRLVIILPLLIVLVSTLYLLGVPSGGGLGYN